MKNVSNTSDEVLSYVIDLQIELNNLYNSKTGLTTMSKNLDIAISAETVEALDYIGWKWWGAPKTDDGLLFELVDIFHFMLTNLIEQHGDSAKQILIKSFESSTQINDDLVNLYRSILFRHEHDRPGEDIALLLSVTRIHGFSVKEFINSYVAKDTLNEFRLINGQVEGSYRKIISGFNDSIFVQNFVIKSRLNTRGLSVQNLEDLKTRVMNTLEIAYNKRQK